MPSIGTREIIISFVTLSVHPCERKNDIIAKSIHPSIRFSLRSAGRHRETIYRRRTENIVRFDLVSRAYVLVDFMLLITEAACTINQVCADNALFFIAMVDDAVYCFVNSSYLQRDAVKMSGSLFGRKSLVSVDHVLPSSKNVRCCDKWRFAHCRGFRVS